MKTPLIVAHRGASSQAPENTLAAFELAWRRGADAIEGDFRLTRDGEIVCIHDADTGRVAAERLVVAESTLAELRRLDVGAWRGARWRGARIPALAEVLAMVPARKGIVIELKDGVEMLPALVRDLEQSGLQAGQVTVIAFDTELVAEVKCRRPDWKVLWLVETSVRWIRLGIRPRAEEVIRGMRRNGADGVGLRSHVLMSGGYVRQIREAGFEVHVWTVDCGWQARRYARMGVQSVTTNRPGVLGSSRRLRGAKT